MNNIPNALKEQSRYLQQLIDEGKTLEEKLNKGSFKFDYYAWHQSVLNTLSPLLRENEQENIVREIQCLAPTSENVEMIRGKMQGMLRDIGKGKLNNLVYKIQKENIEDLLQQSQELLFGEERENKSYILAAILTATVLENSVRKLCELKGIIPEGGKWKPLAKLIGELKEQQVLSKSQADQLEIWKDIRNNAVHGKFDFTPNEIEHMFEGVKRFFNEYL